MIEGKAGSLKFLSGLGLNVPEWIIISHQSLVDSGDQKILLSLKSSLKDKNKNKIRQLAMDFAQSISLKDPVLKFIESNNLYAVRSSASLEDSPENSFAGIFETDLSVPAKSIEKSIKSIWTSLYSEKALNYCNDRNLDWSDLSMDIIIQKMIKGEKSGVMFQADPMGKIDRQIIVAGFGEGQGIVDDVVEVDRIIIQNNYIAEQHIHNSAVLSENEINELIRASKKISEQSDYFMDIEFTIKGNILYFLQSRPITTIPSKKHILIFDNSNIAENYPGQSTPLTFSGLKRGYASNFKNLIRYLGFKDDDWGHLESKIDNMIVSWSGQIYYNLNNWYALITVLPIGHGKVAKSFNEMVGIHTDALIKSPQRSLWRIFIILKNILPKFIALFFFAKKYHQQYKKDFKSYYSEMNEEFLSVREAIEILDFVEKIDYRYMKLIKIPLLNDLFSAILNRSCRTLAKSIAGNDGEQIYNDLLSNKEELESSKAVYSLIDLSRLVRSDETLKTYLQKNKDLKNIPSEDFKQALQKHFDLYGDRSQWEMKIETPTARENPETTIRLILEYADAGVDKESQRKREKDKFETAKLKLDSYFWKKPFKSILFKFIFKKCTEAIGFREDARFDRVRAKGLSRKVALKLGSLLVSKNWIDDTYDIFYLNYEEILSLNQEAYSEGYFKELITLRKKHLRETASYKLPDRIITNDICHAKAFLQSIDQTSTKSIRGLPCSGGIIEALCEVVHDLNHAPNLKDKILIAQRTDPAWGYFFVGVKGIIIEKGSMLSHSAIISRELGIPCIINVKNATQIFQSGMKIRMNGDNGEIERLD
jgi:phosphoenolpyruvate synthase/pyruvate phosphate dikinase